MRRSNVVFFSSCCIIFAFSLSASFGQVTPPKEFLGFSPGDDFKLVTYEQAIGYFELLATQTDRLQVHDMGATSEGRQMKYAIISSDENMAQLDRYKEITRRLSLVRGVSREEAEQLAEEGKSVVWIDGGLHATEVAPSLVNVQLAYDIVTGSDRRTVLIRDNVILLLAFPNPDGVTMVADWYTKNVGTQYETSPLPELYHKYIGHDNNRDSFIANVVETWNMNRLTGREWFPEIHYNQHQSGPFPARIWVPPFGEPTNPNVHPLLTRWVNLIGTAMARGLEAADQPGAISRISYDPWYPGYLKSAIEGQNTPAVMSETQLYRYATPHFYTINDFPEDHRDLTIGQFYPSPWEGGWWRIGDAVAYNLTTTKSVLETAAKFRYELLFSKWKIGHDNIERFQNEPPYGWIMPAEQRDSHAAAQLLNSFINSGIEVYAADEEFSHEGISYPAGSYIIPTSQPFGLYVKNLLEIQEFTDLRNYPRLWQGLTRPGQEENAPPKRPYDGVGWTVPLQMGIESRAINTPLAIKMTKIDEAVPPAGTVSGSGPHVVFSCTGNNGFAALNRILDSGGTVSRALEDFTLAGTQYPKGTFVVESRSINSNTLKAIASETRMPMRGGTVRAALKPISKRRVALYRSWVANMDAGWSTLLFERYNFPYHTLRDGEVRAGNLSERFDVIILSDQAANSIIDGHRKGTMPPAYVGGITANGVENLLQFVEDGGTLICNNSSCDLPIESFDLPVENILQGLSIDEFFSPGSILKMNYDTGHEVAFGMQEKGMAFFSRGRAFDVQPDTSETDANNGKSDITIVAEYPDKSILESGWLIGEEKIGGKAAVLDVAFGDGKIVLFGFNVQSRAQSNATFKLLFNAIYY